MWAWFIQASIHLWLGIGVSHCMVVSIGFLKLLQGLHTLWYLLHHLCHHQLHTLSCLNIHSFKSFIQNFSFHLRCKFRGGGVVYTFFVYTLASLFSNLSHTCIFHIHASSTGVEWKTAKQPFLMFTFSWEIKFITLQAAELKATYLHTLKSNYISQINIHNK